MISAFKNRVAVCDLHFFCRSTLSDLRQVCAPMVHKVSKLTGVTFTAIVSCTSAYAAEQAQQIFPDAVKSDPVTIGWMVGSPPAPDRVIRWSDASFYEFPQLRWSFSHMRELVPTRNISRGLATSSPLPRAEREDLDAVTFNVTGRDKSMTWGDSLKANYTDGIVVLHKGRIVYERYFGALNPQGQHVAWSVTKSLIGTIGAMMVEEKTLDPNANVTKYIPELQASTGFRDATVRQVMDMTTGIQFSEEYADPNAEIWSQAIAGGVLPRPEGWTGAKTFTEFMTTVKKQGQHDEAFGYRTVNTDVLAWLIERASGKPLTEHLSERFWTKLGNEQDAYIMIDSVGTPFSSSINTGLRDLARFGEMMRQDGRFNGQQIVPKAVVDDIRGGADKAKFAKAGFSSLPGWSYRNQWWVSHNEHGAYTAFGVHGQLLYIDPKAEMVIARYASYPLADSETLDSTSLPAYHALAKYLIANPR